MLLVAIILLLGLVYFLEALYFIWKQKSNSQSQEL